MGSIASIIAGIATTNIGNAVSRYKRNGALFAIACLFFLIASAFFLIALAVWLSREYGTIEAMLYIAAAALALGIVVVVVVAICNARDKRFDLQRSRRSQAQTGLVVASALTIFRKKPLLMTALVAGTFLLLGATSGSRNRRDD